MAQKWDFKWMVVFERKIGTTPVSIPNALGGTMELPAPAYGWFASLEDERLPLDEALARFADAGWELAGTATLSSQPGPPRGARHMLYFKRPRD